MYHLSEDSSAAPVCKYSKAATPYDKLVKYIISKAFKKWRSRGLLNAFLTEWSSLPPCPPPRPPPWPPPWPLKKSVRERDHVELFFEIKMDYQLSCKKPGLKLFRSMSKKRLVSDICRICILATGPSKKIFRNVYGAGHFHNIWHIKDKRVIKDIK